MSKIYMEEAQGMCMSCGKIFKGNTRALVEGQFSWHNEEKHKRKLNAMEVLVLKFFTGEPPKIEKKVVKKREGKKKWVKGAVGSKDEGKAEWV